MATTSTTANSGYFAESPWDIPWAGWKKIFLRVKDKIGEDNVSIVSAGVAFYFFLALFPAIAAIFSMYGLVVDPAQVEQQLKQAADALPKEAHQLVSGILTQTAEKSGQTLGWGLIASILFSLWSASKATAAMFEGVNIAYHESNNRKFLLKKVIILLFTFGAIVTGIIAIAFVVAFPAFIDKLGLPPLIRNGLALLRWVLLGLIVYSVVVTLYRIAPDRATPKVKWINPGAIFATVVWLGGSLLFTLYINNFGKYDKTYGSLAAVVILMLWLFITGYIIITGAELNAQIEHQTSTDTTTGTVKPMGERGAYYADRVADNGNKNGKTHSK